jgi:hypothetical protein
MYKLMLMTLSYGTLILYQSCASLADVDRRLPLTTSPLAIAVGVLGLLLAGSLSVVLALAPPSLEAPAIEGPAALNRNVAVSNSASILAIVDCFIPFTFIQ